VTKGRSVADNVRLESIVQLLEELSNTSPGFVLQEQLARVIEDWRSSLLGVDQTYTNLLIILLNTLSDNRNGAGIAKPEPILTNALQPSLQNDRRQQITPTPNQASIDNDNRLTSAIESLRDAISGQETRSSTETLQQTENRGLPPEKQLSDTEGDNAQEEHEKTYPEVERRVNSAYRQHLDRKHGEIEKLQEVLAQKAVEAIAQNKEFGALLEIERGALQQASSITEIEELKEILIGGTEELIEGQRTLSEKLRSSFDYLKIIKSDSERLHDELSKVRLLSLTDEYTGLPNRRAFMRRLKDEIARAQRYETSLVLVLIDLDHFKNINDQYGHQAGDEVLNWYSHNALTIFRHYDMVARYGGEEFAVLFPNTTHEGALKALYKMRVRLDNAKCTFNDITIDIPTFSAGLTIYQDGEKPEDFINRADKTLYRAKNQGRNCIEVGLPSEQEINQTNGV